ARARGDAPVDQTRIVAAVVLAEVVEVVTASATARPRRPDAGGLGDQRRGRRHAPRKDDDLVTADRGRGLHEESEREARGDTDGAEPLTSATRERFLPRHEALLVRAEALEVP